MKIVCLNYIIIILIDKPLLTRLLNICNNVNNFVVDRQYKTLRLLANSYCHLQQQNLTSSLRCKRTTVPLKICLNTVYHFYIMCNTF